VIEEFLGAGGMGAVYAARRSDGVRVAVKILHPEEAAHEDTRARFLREGYVANHVGHPGIARVLDDGTGEDGAAFLVMELLDGQSVEQRRQRHEPLTVAEIVGIAVVVLEVLEAAHEKGIVHRDIKPDNVFLTRDGAVKVLDFGIARVNDGSRTSTTTGTAMGTPAFMPKEQALGLVREIDGRTDVWAIGALMYRLLTGRFVHDGAETGAQMLVFAATRPACPIGLLSPGLSAGLGAVVDRALAFEKEDRWPDASSMRRALVALHGDELAGFAVTALSSSGFAATVRDSRPPELAAVGPRIRRTQIAIAIAALLTLAAGAFALGALLRAPVHVPEASAATTPAVVASPAPPPPVEPALEPTVAPTPTPPAIATASGTSAGPGQRNVRRSNAKDCDPPWSLGANGVRIYKRRCM